MSRWPQTFYFSHRHWLFETRRAGKIPQGWRLPKLTQSGNYRNTSTLHFALLDADDRIWTDQWFNTRFDKARIPKPTHAVGAGEIEPFPRASAARVLASL
jgi:hypothetical protein